MVIEAHEDEFVALADAWFGKLDSDRTGKLSQEQFVARVGEVLPPPQGFGPPVARLRGRTATGRRRGGFGSRCLSGGGPGLFARLTPTGMAS